MPIPRRAHFVTRHKYLAAIATELAAPAIRAAARLHAGRGATPPSEWRRGLIIGHTHIGDVLYRTPSLHALRAGLPDCEWDVLVAPLSAPVLRGNPHVHDAPPLNVGDRTWTLAPGGYDALRERRYDVALCTNAIETYVDFALAAALAIPNRVGFTYKGASALVTHPAPIRVPDSFPGYVRQIVAHVTGKAPDWDLTPQIFLDADDEAEADRVWDEEGFDAANPPIACAPIGRQRGLWPVSALLAPVRLLHEELAAPVALCGGPADRAVLAAEASAAQLPAHVLAGRLSLRGFAAFLRRCRVLVAYDSGPRHLGNAVGVPVAFAPNLTATRVETGRYCENEIDLGPADERLAVRDVPAVVARYPARVMADRVHAHLAAREDSAAAARAAPAAPDPAC